MAKESKKSKNRTVWCDRSWFPFYFGFVPDKASWEIETKELGYDGQYIERGAACDTLKTNLGRTVVLVTMSEKCDDLDAVGLTGLMVHEATHVFDAMLRAMGEKKPSSEFKAYSVQCIYQQLMEAYIKTRNKKLFVND